MSVAGRDRPALMLVSRASFHLVIFPRKMSAMTSGVNFTGCASPGKLYATTTAPSTVGMWSTLPPIAAIAESVIGASDAQIGRASCRERVWIEVVAGVVGKEGR